MNALLKFALQDLRSSKGALLLSSTVVAISVGFLMLLTSGHMQLESYVLVGTNVQYDLRVTATERDVLGLTKVTTKGLDDEAVEEVENTSGVAKVQREALLSVPSSMQVEMFGSRFESDVPLYAVEMESEALEEGKVPIVLSSQLLALYNLGLADSLGTPKLSEQVLIGRSFDLYIGYSSFFRQGRDEALKLEGVVTELSEQVPVLGMTIPLKAAKEVVEQYPEASLRTIALDLTLEGAASSDEVREILLEKGYTVQSSAEEIEEARGLSRTLFQLTLLLGSVVSVLTLLFLLYVLLTTLKEKAHLLALMQLHGAKGRHMQVFAMTHIGTSILLGSLAGVFSGAAIYQVALAPYMNALLGMQENAIAISLRGGMTLGLGILGAFILFALLSFPYVATRSIAAKR